jgi:Fis family transcriptional regulator
MAARSKTNKLRREPQPTGKAVIGEASLGVNGHMNGHAVNGRAVPLRSLTEQALDTYFASLNGHAPGQLYDLVLREVEEPLFRAVLDYSAGNQSRAADILGINRGTLRKKLRVYGIAG